MDIKTLQTRLRDTLRYRGNIDGLYGPQTRSAVELAMTDGPDTRLTYADFVASAKRLGVTVAHVQAVTAVESAGAGFIGDRPTLLFEPHRFSRATKGKFDQLASDVSYPKWDKTRYPRTASARWAQLVKAMGLDVDAGFASASYGRFQILGENFAICGFATSFDFAVSQAHDEVMQLRSFEAFITARGLLAALCRQDWDAFAAGYNGTAYRQNAYHKRLRTAFVAAGGK